MERKLVWTERASGDVEAIVRYIARRDPQAAGRIGVGIYDRVQILQANPEAGSILDCNAAHCLVGAESRRQRIRSWKQVRGHGRILQISNGSQ